MHGRGSVPIVMGLPLAALWAAGAPVRLTTQRSTFYRKYSYCGSTSDGHQKRLGE